ncbi:hypothetical protein OAQ08_05010, partial [Alphaproteobacteria bacterium]|nr:hypothetical protein [Alphaproteobacteria bacterium]
QINLTPEERTFCFSLVENNYLLYKKNILNEFKKIEETSRKKIHEMGFRLGKNIIYNSELLKPEFILMKFYLWAIYYDLKFKTSDYIPKDGNSTIIFKNNDRKLYEFLGFYKELNFLIRYDVFNDFEKILFKRESRGPYALPIDLSNLLGIKKEKLIEILVARKMRIVPIGDNDYMVFKSYKAEIDKKSNNKNNSQIKVKKPQKTKQLFNNPFNDLSKLNV